MAPKSKAFIHKSLSLAIGLYLIFIFGFGYVSYSVDKRKSYEIIDQQLEVAARTATLILPSDLHHYGMKQSDLTAQQDKDNREALSQLAINNNVTYIYSLIEQGREVVFTSSSATEEERASGEGLSLFFSVYDDVDPRVYDIFKTGERVFIEYADSWGTFRSVFIPQKAKDGTPYLVAADISISHIDALLKKNLYQTLLISLLFLVFVYPLYLVMTRKLTLYTEKLNQQVKQQTIALITNAERLDLALQASKQGWFDVDLTTGNVLVSDQYPLLLGFDPTTFKSNLAVWQDSIHPDDKKEVMETFYNCISKSRLVEVEYRRKKKDGTWLWFHSIGQVVEWNKEHKPCRMVGVHMDISEQKKSAQLLRESEDKYRAMFETALVGMALNNKDGMLLEANQAYLDIIGYTADEARKLTYWDVTPPLYKDLEAAQLKSLKEKGRYGPYEKEYLHKDGHLVPVLVNGVSVIGSDNEAYTWSCIYDITERKKIEEGRKLSARVFTVTHEGITITDANRIIVDINPAFTTITGYSREDVIGKSPEFLNSGKHGQEFYDDMWHTINQQGHWQGEVWNRKKSGELYAELLTVSSVVDDEKIVTNYVGVFSDITRIKAHQEQLDMLAHYDVLTNLPNRTLFISRFDLAIAHSNRNKSQLAICFLDLDEFKPINDNFGHEVGDQILIEVAERLKNTIRAEDTVSRQGGDEFAILLNDIDSVAKFERTLVRIHQTLAQPFMIDGVEHKISASSGVTIYPDDNGDIDTLLRHADQAMYQAKQAGRNRYQLFNAELEQKARLKQNKFHEIEYALMNAELQLYYQPKVNLLTGKVFGVEALLRWFHPSRGLIPPLDFLPFIENTELDLRVGDWVIEQALQKLDEWHDQGLQLEVSVNITAHQLVSNHFIYHLKAMLAKHPSVNAQYLQLEILESTALNDLKVISNIIGTCQKELGLTISLDDFGTGYSSLAHLRNLPVNTIKIDQTFVRDMLDDPSDYAIIDGVIGMADSFNRNVIAEGVETIEHGLMLLVMGCEAAQGYGIAKPMPADDIPQWLTHYTPHQEWLLCNAKYLSDEEKKVKLFKLVSKHWVEKFIANIQTSPEIVKDWPIMDSHHCLCGTWISRAKQEQTLGPEAIELLYKEHEQVHIIANAILIKYQKGSFKAAEADLSALNIAFGVMSKALLSGE